MTPSPTVHTQTITPSPASREPRARRLVLAGLCAALLGGSAFRAEAQIQRLLGLDISCWQGSLSQTVWNNFATNENRRFVVLRSSRGGTTGEDHRSCGFPSGDNTYTNLSQRYDDPYFVQNINRATAAGMFAGTYHFSRPDIIATTGNSGGIPNNGTDEADHFIQMAGPWMRPGYLPPMHDLEAGDGKRTDNEMAQFCIDFSNRIYEQMGIRPGIYINGNYAAFILQTASQALRDQLAKPPPNLPTNASPSVVSPCYPYLWSARWPNQTNPDQIDVQNGEPKDSYTAIYGPFDDYGVTHPWKFWQYASTLRLQSYNNGGSNLDADVARGGYEFVKDQLIPAVWLNDSSGDWSTLANWNSGQTPVQPPQLPGQVTPVATGPLPTPRLPGGAAPNFTHGSNDTVILERPNANITVTLSSGTHNIRKLYLRETLSITGGALTINYIPSADSTPFGAQFSGPVTLGGSGSFTVHTLQVDSTQTFTLSGGTLSFNTINLMPHTTTPAKILVSGNVSINPLADATAALANGVGSGSLGYVDLGGHTRTLTVGDGAAAVDLAVGVSVSNGALAKGGPGTLALLSANSYSGGTTVSAGTLLVNNSTGSGTGSGGVTVNGGILGGTGIIAGTVTVNSSGTLAPGTSAALGTLTVNSAPVLGGTNYARINRNGGTPLADKLVLTSGTLHYGGRLVVANVGAALVNGDTFTLFNAGAYTGAFSAVELPAPGGNLSWDLSSLAVNGTIKVISVTAPVISSGPQNLTVVEGQNATFSVSATGSQPLSYQWRFNGGDIGGATASSYTRSNAQLADAGSYSVLVTNLGGSTPSTNAILTVTALPTPPAIAGQPQSQTVIQGGTASFSVAATGSAPLGYQWRRNGADIAGATDSAYNRGNVQTTDAGSYSVVITNSVGATNSADAVLTVHFSLAATATAGGMVSKSPDQASYAPDAAVTLTATPDTGYAFIGWSGDASGTNNPLDVTMTANKAIGASFVSAETDIILDNTNAAVSFVGLWQTGAATGGKYGDDYRFALTAAGGLSNAVFRPYIYLPGRYDVYIWYTTGANRATNAPWSIVYDGGSLDVSVDQQTNGADWVLIGSELPFAQGTNGYARLSNDTGYSGKVVLADAVRFTYVGPLHVAPTITTHPAGQNVNQGGNAVFEVLATGTPAPGYQWRKDGVPIAGATDTSYTVANAQPADASTYSVVVSNIAGTATSDDAALTVNVAPTITTQPADQNVNQTSNAVFSVVAAGTPAPAYQWRKDGAPIGGATDASYTVANAQPGDAGSYSVVVSNIAGTAISDDALLTVNVAPTITGQPADQNVNQTSNAVFSVVATGTPAPAYQWRKDGAPIGGATDASYTVANAQPGDAGSYSVVVSNIAGTATSDDAILTVNLAPAQPQIDSITLISGGQIQLQVSTEAGRYALDFTTNLTLPAWVELTNFTTTGGTTQCVDSAVGQGQRFYRVRLIP